MKSARLFSRILCPVDGSRFSYHAVDMACRIAGCQESALLQIHVVDIGVEKKLVKLTGRPREDLHLELRRSAEGFLRDMESSSATRGVQVGIKLYEGIPHEVILETARDWKADLIVMGKLGRRGVSGILMGSVARRVIEFSEIPVLVAPGSSSALI